MAFEPSERGDYVDRERGMTAKLIRGGPDGRTGWRISAPEWSFEFNVREQFPPERDAIKVESLDLKRQFPGTKNEAAALAEEFLDVWRRQPFRMKGRAGPKPIII